MLSICWMEPQPALPKIPPKLPVRSLPPMVAELLGQALVRLGTRCADLMLTHEGKALLSEKPGKDRLSKRRR